jgi:hypothetical protein
MKTDALRLPFFLNTIVTSPSSPPSSSSSPALHVSTTTHHWGQAPLRQWFISPSTKLVQLVLQLLRDVRHHQSLSARGNCVHLPRRHLASQPLSPRAHHSHLGSASKGTRFTIPSACSSPSIACSPSCLALTRSGASTRTKFFLAQQLRKPLLQHRSPLG